MPVSKCPQCGKKRDQHDYLFGPSRTPKPGNISVCLYCGNVSQWNEYMILHPMGGDEIRALPRKTRREIRNVLGALADVHRSRDN